MTLHRSIFATSHLLALAMLWLTSHSPLAAKEPAPVHPMVPMFHLWDYEKAAQRITKVAETGARRISFTILMLVELEPGFKVKHYGATWSRKKADGGIEYAFQPMTESIRKQIRLEFEKAFAQAVKHNLEINILPQIDATGEITEWRNFFDFDPTTKLGGYSYETAMLETVLEALEATVPSGHPVEMTLEGEMGCSLFTHPAAWHDMLKHIRSRQKLDKLRLGISANYEGVSGKVVPTAAQQKAMTQLIESSDFIGLSCYAKTAVPPTVNDFTACVNKFCEEFQTAGSPIPATKPLRFTELGHGGGGFDKDWKLIVPGPMLDRMGRASFFGTDKVEKNPWTTPERIAFRRDFYQAALQFLTTQPAKWRVEQAYLWSFGSWDVHGITNPVFADTEITADITKHNRALQN